MLKDVKTWKHIPGPWIGKLIFLKCQYYIIVQMHCEPYQNLDFFFPDRKSI